MTYGHVGTVQRKNGIGYQQMRDDDEDTDTMDGYYDEPARSVLPSAMTRQGIHTIKDLMEKYVDVDFGAGGDCLFKSLLQVLAQRGLYDGSSHLTLRKEIVSNMRSNAHHEVLRRYMLNDYMETELGKRRPRADLFALWDKDLYAEEVDRALKLYLDDMQRPRKWGGGAVLIAVAEMFDVAIQVVNLTDNETMCYNRHAPMWIGLLYMWLGGDTKHYRALMPRPPGRADRQRHRDQGRPCATTRAPRSRSKSPQSPRCK